MATRTIKLMGNAYSTTGDVSLLVKFNDVEVHNGVVPTTNSELPSTPGSEAVEMASWTIDTDTTGDTFIEIVPSGGTFVFGYLHGNYGRDGVQGDDPTTIWDHMYENTLEFEGKQNPAVNNEDISTQYTPTEDSLGPWFYVIGDSLSFTCKYRIDPDMIVLDSNDYPAPADPA